MFDIEELKNEGFNPDLLAAAIERALMGLVNCRSNEANWLSGHLESMRDECEGAE